MTPINIGIGIIKFQNIVEEDIWDFLGFQRERRNITDEFNAQEMVCFIGGDLQWDLEVLRPFDELFLTS